VVRAHGRLAVTLAKAESILFWRRSPTSGKANTGPSAAVCTERGVGASFANDAGGCIRRRYHA
jgi:hypothetical protein